VKFSCPTLALLLLVSGCGFGGELHSFEDEGRLCLGVDESFGSLPIEADQPFFVSVFSPGCFSSSCSTLESATCQVTLDGQDLRISSFIEVRDTSARAGACTDDCHSYTARCEAPALPEGEFTVRLGDESLPLTVPTDEPPCSDYF
jgi:hypothetical protein